MALFESIHISAYTSSDLSVLKKHLSFGKCHNFLWCLGA